jgi:hypothetical protein
VIFIINRNFNITNVALVILSVFFSWTVFLIILNVIQGEVVYFSKVYAFIQAIIALLMGYILQKEIKNQKIIQKSINFSLIIYIIFSLVYIIFDGKIETVLFYHLTGNSSDFLSGDGGRGIATLSPEPSYFAGILSNITLFCLLAKKESLFIYLAVAILLFLTFSMTGLFLGLLTFLLIINNKLILKQKILLMMILVVVALFTYSKIDYNSVRFFVVLENILSSGEIQDVSTLTRLDSVNQSIKIFLDHPFGIGFTKESLGGFIYLIEIYGVLFIPIFILLVATTMKKSQSLSEKIFIVGWFLFYFFNGFIFFPLTYFTFGYIIRARTR